MATGPADICNMALLRIGAKGVIASIDDATEEARVCKVFYTTLRDAVLSAAPWTFAKKQASLALLSTVKRTGWGYAYSLPSDCLKPRAIWPGTRVPSAGKRVPFEVQVSDDLGARYLFTDVTNAELVYTARVTAEVLFSPLFVNALAWSMAVDLAPALQAKAELELRATLKAKSAIDQAIAETVDEADEYTPESEFIEARD